VYKQYRCSKRLSVLVVDNLSPFTPDILISLRRLGKSYVHRRFFEVSDTDLTGSERVILSGRRKYSKEINMINSKIIRYCWRQNKSLLGICYGAEIIALTFGGSITKMPSHIQGLTKVSVSDTNVLTQERYSILVYESHKYCIAKLPPNFVSLASSQYCQHEVFCSDENKVYGTQFHPERSGDDGLYLLNNFLNT
jgi:GMP synthase (glutamine-hydrolysing)